MKNTRERKMVFSNVKSNKKKADEKSASNSNEIFDYNNEIVIGLKVLPEPKIDKKQNNKSTLETLPQTGNQQSAWAVFAGLIATVMSSLMMLLGIKKGHDDKEKNLTNNRKHTITNRI